MIDYEILEEFGTDPKRLRAVFTAESDSKLNVHGEQLYKREAKTQEDPPKKKDFAEKLFKTRKKWEDRIQTRIQNGRELSMRNYRMYMAADLAFDASPITPERFAHMLYASGDLKVDFQELYTEVRKVSGDKLADEMFVRDEKSPHNIVGINVPKLTDITVNLVRPYIRRSVAAQVNRYENMFPFMRYESRSQGLDGKLRADVLSERVEVMTDQFGYRHLLGQEIRGMFLHSHSVSFVENSWAAHRQLHRVHDESTPEGWRMRETIEKEGVRFKKVHPTRVFYDTRYPLASINFDGGCQYLGYWDIVQYRDIENNGNFFNTDKIPYSTTLHNYSRTYSPYFQNYYASTLKNIVDRPSGAELNSRDANTYAYYTTSNPDECLWLTHYYERVTPNQCGLGAYPHPVWVHLIVAGDNTVVFAEILPSRPAYCLHYDENDDRLVNPSMAIDILPYQDQVSNLTSQMLYLLQINNLLIMAVDADVVPESIRNELKKVVKGRKLFEQVHCIEFDSKVEEIYDRHISQKRPIEVFQANVANIIRDLMGAITSHISMLERNQMMSPNEMGQFVERETSATEVQQVSSTSNDLHSFKSSGIDEARHAMKVILYESLVACSSKTVRVSVPERYPDEVIHAAGFRKREQSYTQENGTNLIGTTEALVGEYVFSSRDGAERSSNTEAAKVLMELMRYIMGSEQSFQAFVEAFGMEQISKSLSEIFRLSGSPMTLKLPVEFDEAEFKAGLRDEITAKLDELEQRLAPVEQLAQQQAMAAPPPMEGPPPGAMPPQGPGGAMQGPM